LAERGEAAALAPPAAEALLRLLGAAMLGTSAVHCAICLLWRLLPLCRARPMPAFLAPPAPQLLLGHVTVLPLATASMLLLVQPGSPNARAAAGAGLAALLLHLALVAAVVLAVAARGDALGLRYLAHRQRQQRQEQPGSAAAHSSGAPPPVSSGGSWAFATLGRAGPGTEGIDPEAAMLQRLAPGHLVGHWGRADQRRQRELRLAYQGGRAPGGQPRPAAAAAAAALPASAACRCCLPVLPASSC
jgi:hypothetical protein